MARRRKRGFGNLATRKYGSCGAIKWRCESAPGGGGLCTALGGKHQGRSLWSVPLLRAECTSLDRCKAEVLIGRHMVGRKRDLPSMDAAKAWACERARKG